MAVPLEGQGLDLGSELQEERHSPNNSSPALCYLAWHMVWGWWGSLAPRAGPAAAFSEVPVPGGGSWPWGATEHPGAGPSRGASRGRAVPQGIPALATARVRKREAPRACPTSGLGICVCKARASEPWCHCSPGPSPPGTALAAALGTAGLRETRLREHSLTWGAWVWAKGEAQV